MQRVLPAEPYNQSELGSFGKASYMLIRQFQFPDTYSNDERRIQVDSDRCFSADYKNTRRCFTEHTGTGEGGLGSWARRATDEQIVLFLKDILKADTTVIWTGYRIMVTVHRENGFPVWTLELFAKNPGSSTKVFTGENTPNVLRGART